jgi:hypothetical protein
MIAWLRYLIAHFLGPGAGAAGDSRVKDFTFDHVGFPSLAYEEQIDRARAWSRHSRVDVRRPHRPRTPRLP